MSFDVSVKYNGKKIAAKYDSAIDRAVSNAADALLGEANLKVPHADTGDLERSATTYKDSDKEHSFALSYTGAYAVYQHEGVSKNGHELRHPDPTNENSRAGTESHWLENAAKRNEDAVKDFIALQLKAGRQR